MSPHGIASLRAYLAGLPQTETIAERRAVYDRAEKVFKVPAETVVEKVTTRGVSAASGCGPPARAPTPRSCTCTAAAT